MILTEPLTITQLVTTVLEHLQIPYVVGGSLASSLHGIPRATQDVDLLAAIHLPQVELVVAALQESFYIDADSVRTAIEHSASFNVIHLTTMFKVDIFVLSPDDLWSQQELARKERYEIGTPPTQHLFLATAEDIIIQKLYWFQLGGSISERQWQDVLGVLKVKQSQLDYSYLQSLAQLRGVDTLLERVLGEVCRDR
jgi:hypothetical protein